MGRPAPLSEKYDGEVFRFRFDPTVAERLNYGMRGTDSDVRQDWKIIVNKVNELVVSAGAIAAFIPRESISRVDYTDELPPNNTSGTWRDGGTFWAVPALEALVSIEVDPPSEGYYVHHSFPASRLIVSIEDPDRFIEVIKPADQESVSQRQIRRADVQIEDWKPPHLATSVEVLWINFVRRLLGLMKQWVDQYGIPTRRDPYVDFSTSPPSHICKEREWPAKLLGNGQAFLMSMPELDLLADRLLHDGILQLRFVDSAGQPDVGQKAAADTP
jgi:hypothetical protein